MKRLSYFLILAIAALSFSCEELPAPTVSKYLNVKTSLLELKDSEGSFKISVESNTAWVVTTSADWLTVVGAHECIGSGDAMFSYTANTSDKSRNAKIEIAPKVAGETSTYLIMVSQKAASGNTGGSGDNTGGDDNTGSGDNTGGGNTGTTAGSGNGTAESPYDVIRALAIINGGTATESKVYVQGVISSIEEVAPSYGNASYYISNNGATYNSQLYIYRGKYLNNENFTSTSQIKVGDEVVICGQLKLWNGNSPQVIGGNYLISINGSTTGGDDNTGSGDNTGGGLVTNGGTPHAGWAELPAEENNSDYYYAYHMRADKGTQRNFSVCYSAEMGCPVWVAAPIHKCYCGSGRSENYAPDPVIPSSVQKNADKAGDTNKGNWMNRGHMLASNMRNVTATTNQQVFYYSNIAPQDGDGFNTGGGWWNDLEDIEKNQYMCSDTLYTVNGCHWANKNETFGNRVVPTHFYKVFLRTKKGSSGKWVVNCSESELQCVAFYAPHYHGSGGKTAPTRSHMMSVAELERITGHTFFPNVPNAPKDTFNPSDWGM